MADADFELRRGPGFNLLAQPTLLPAVISSFYIQNKGGGAGTPPPPPPRSATELCKVKGQHTKNRTANVRMSRTVFYRSLYTILHFFLAARFFFFARCFPRCTLTECLEEATWMKAFDGPSLSSLLNVNVAFDACPVRMIP